MNNILIAYFSASGVTKCVAEKLATITNGKLYEIVPEKPYTNDDLNWMDKNSRSSLEMKDTSSRPAIREKIDNMDEYNTIYLGFPIWWGIAPTIINTFLESYDMAGKTIITFATSGGSQMGSTLSKLEPSAPNAHFINGKIISPSSTPEEIKELLNI